jgi:hypothetical protein
VRYLRSSLDKASASVGYTPGEAGGGIAFASRVKTCDSHKVTA